MKPGKPHKCSSTLILDIIEKFGTEDNRELMSSLKSLRVEVRREAFTAINKRLKPLIHFEQFKNLK